MRPDVDLLRDIVKTASELDLIVAGLDEDTFSVTDVVRSAAMYKLIVIGEAAAKLSDGLREQFGHVPWPAIISFRNRATHAYFAVDWTIVYEIARRDVPQLADQVKTILDGSTEENDL